MLVAVNICPGERLGETLAAIAGELRRARRYAELGETDPVRILGPRPAVERGLFVLQYRLVPTGIGKDEAWSREPARLFRAGKRTG